MSETEKKNKSQQALFAAQTDKCLVCYAKQLKRDHSLPSPFDVTLTWDKCTCCGFAFMNPKLLPETMYQIYTSPEYWSNYAYSRYYEGEPVRLENSTYRLKRYSKFIPKSGKLLDLGCATGFFAYAASKLGYEVTGVDLNSEMIEYGRKHYQIDLRISKIEDCNFQPNTFDVISMWGLDCHFFDFRAAFTKIISWLKPGGCILFGYQDYSHWIRWFVPKINQDPNAYYNFTVEALTRLMSQLGMRIVYNRTGIQISQLHRITRSLKLGKNLFSKWDHVKIRIPTLSYNVAILQKES